MSDTNENSLRLPPGLVCTTMTPVVLLCTHCGRDVSTGWNLFDSERQTHTCLVCVSRLVDRLSALESRVAALERLEQYEGE